MAAPSDPAHQAYAADFADQYDAWFSKPATTPDTVGLLAQLAGPGPVLELGIGTGRVALPLRARGLDVHGLEGSLTMVACLRGKPGGGNVPVTVGDFADVAVPGKFSLIYLAAGTFAELLTQEAQARCMRNAAHRLRPGGLLVFDAFLPEALCELASSEPLLVPTANGDHMVCSRVLNRVTQRYTSCYSITALDTTHRVEVSFRYAGLGELDLMAGMAGLRLRERWGGWKGVSLHEASQYHVSCYGLDVDHG